jgi:mannosyltransferase OCH1-like enzyme
MRGRGHRQNKRTRRRSKKRHTRRKRVFPGRQRGGADLGVIPRIVLQTSKDPIPERVLTQLKAQLDGWEYLHFTDADILTFFQENPSDQYPDIINKFNSFATGPHKADLFRYYYMYMNGGLFIDSDLMLYDPLQSIVGENSFVSVWAIKPPGSVFNGFLGATAKHPIIESALKDLYAMTNDQLQADYTIVCAHLGGFVTSFAEGNVKMLKETVNMDTHCHIQDPDSGKISLIHYQNMEIPDAGVGL